MNDYLLRGTAVALSEFVLVYFVAWLAITGGWSLWVRNARRVDHVSSRLLYALQLSPFLLALAAVLAFSVPAFVRFEPHRVEEEFGVPLLLLGSAALAFFAVGMWRAGSAVLRSRNVTRKWECAAVSVESDGVPVVQTGPDAPPLVVAGLLRPKFYVSSTAWQALSPQELTRAIAHEAAHVQRHDNLKKLLLRFCSVPASKSLERRWLASLELAADEDAVASRREALDLASALVKASKLAAPSPDLATTFTGDGADLLRRRVERLLSWDARQPVRPLRARVCAVLSLGVLTFSLACCYPAVLLAVHRFSELLVR